VDVSLGVGCGHHDFGKLHSSLNLEILELFLPFVKDVFFLVVVVVVDHSWKTVLAFVFKQKLLEKLIELDSAIVISCAADTPNTGIDEKSLDAILELV
jgi:hypothetical protein